jgi:PAS domain S-box-containing protein
MASQAFGWPGEGAAPGKDLEAYLQTHAKLAGALLESAAQAIVATDRNGRILLANAKTEEMFGYARHELIGQPVEVLLPQSVHDVHIVHRREFFAKPRIRPMGIGLDLSGRRRDGTEFAIEVSLSHIGTDEGTFAIAFISDITQRKRLEEQLFHAQKMEAVGRLAGGVAHDFNNMLTIISGYNQMLLSRLSPMDPMRGYAEEVAKAAERAGALTNQLLAFSRRQIIQPRVFDLNALVRQTEGMLRRLIGEDVELTFLLGEHGGRIKVDPGQLEQILVNLAANARDAMPRGGKLTIETHLARLDENYAMTHLGVKPGEYLMLAISDTGDGMDAETKRRIFEPFFTTKEQGKGTGLGLATVYGIVKQSGGDIWVYSEQGQGTTFKVYFPRVAEAASEAGESEAPAAQRGGETILVVEDETAVRQLIAAMMRQQGYTVIVAESPADATRIAAERSGSIEMLLTDVVMPQMSGKQLADELVRGRPEMKVLYLSGYTQNAIAHHGVLDADVEFLGKPFSQGALANKVREVLDK